LRRAGSWCRVKKPARSADKSQRGICAHPDPLEEAALSVDHPHLPSRRAIVRHGGALLLLAVALLGFPARGVADDTRPVVFIFLQLDVKSSALEQALQRQLPGLTLTVYGRFRDFEDGVATQNPDAVLAIAQLLDLNHIKPTLQGVRGGKEWEPYLLVTTAAVEPKSWAGKTVGIIDLLGRDGTQSFAATALGAPDVKVKRVAKIEDLLPLLEFSAADAVLIPGSAVKRFTDRTRLSLKVRELPNARVGLPAVAVRNEKARNTVVQAMQRLDTETRSLIGIDNWSAR
jgi:hypothetical protein